MERETRPLNKKQLQSQATLETLRAVVDKLVNELGFEKMHIRDICREAGITPGTFYHYFSSKDDILFDRYHRANAVFNKLYGTRLKKMHEIDALKLLLKEFIKWERKRVIGVLIPFQRARLLHHARWTERERAAWPDILLALFKAGLEGGTIKPGFSPLQLSGFFVCFLDGMVVNQCYSQGKSLERPDFLEPLNQWLESLRVREAARPH
jgi:AcrR family transcriptional regulator